MKRKQTNWKTMIISEMKDHGDGDNIDDLVACTLSEGELLNLFEDGWGATSGEPFTAWTEKRVYFPVCYDGAEWAGSAPRHPCDEATDHQGGGG